MYKPVPVDIIDIVLSEKLLELKELIAENVHGV